MVDSSEPKALSKKGPGWASLIAGETEIVAARYVLLGWMKQRAGQCSPFRTRDAGLSTLGSSQGKNSHRYRMKFLSGGQGPWVTAILSTQGRGSSCRGTKVAVSCAEQGFKGTRLLGKSQEHTSNGAGDQSNLVTTFAACPNPWYSVISCAEAAAEVGQMTLNRGGLGPGIIYPCVTCYQLYWHISQSVTAPFPDKPG